MDNIRHIVVAVEEVIGYEIEHSADHSRGDILTALAEVVELFDLFYVGNIIYRDGRHRNIVKMKRIIIIAEAVFELIIVAVSEIRVRKGNQPVAVNIKVLYDPGAVAVNFGNKRDFFAVVALCGKNIHAIL